MNAPPATLMDELDRTLQSGWTERIPNRRYARIDPVVHATTPSGSFAGELLEEAQPLPVAGTKAPGLLAALVGAQRSGRGSFVDVSMTHEVWRHHVIVEAALAATGRTPPPGRDLLSGGVACYGVYRCADGRWLAVGALELKFWRSLCKTVGRSQWGDQHWSLGERPGSAPALARRDQLAALFASEPASHWLALTDGADCCVCPVLRRDEAQALGWLASA